MKGTERNFIVGILTKDRKVADALAQEFEDKKNVTVIDFTNINSELFKKFINNSRLDIVVAAEDTFTDPESRKKVDEVIQKGNNTYFLPIYNDENVKKMLEVSDILGKNKIVTTSCKIEEDSDYELLATNVHGAINRKIQMERRAENTISEIVDSFRGEE